MSAAPHPSNDRNLTAHAPLLGREERSRLLNARGATVWLTGLSGSGKSTIATALEHALVRRGVHAYVLDGDNIRLGLNRDLGFSHEERTENVRRVGEVARLLADAGVIAIAGFISPYRADRDAVRARHDESGLPFLEVFLDTPLAVCEERDPKGLYKKARAGQIAQFTGIDDPYERPQKPELTLSPGVQGVEECVQACVAMLQRFHIPGR
jgi:adenylylsulfate kinase